MFLSIFRNKKNLLRIGRLELQNFSLVFCRTTEKFKVVAETASGKKDTSGYLVFRFQGLAALYFQVKVVRTPCLHVTKPQKH